NIAANRLIEKLRSFFSAPFVSPSKFLFLIFSTLLWLGAVGAGVCALTNYSYAPGGCGKIPARWPASSKISRATDRATLVMLVHPHCPCSRASIGELAKLIAQSRGLVSAHVLFLEPENFSESWTKTDLWESAVSIPGVNVMIDQDGKEARRFGGETSGTTILY